MLLGKFGNDFVFELDLGLECLDFLVFRIVRFGFSPEPSECGARVLKELLLPLLNLCRLQPQFVTKVRDGNFVDQIPLHNSGFFLSSEHSSRSCHRNVLLRTAE